MQPFAAKCSRRRLLSALALLVLALSLVLAAARRSMRVRARPARVLAREARCSPLAPLTPADLPPKAVHAFNREHPERVHNRSLYATVLSLSHLKVFLSVWPDQERFLFVPNDAHFLLAVVAQDGVAVASALSKVLKWRRVAPFTRAQLRYPCDGHVDMAPHLDYLQGWWLTPAGVTVLLVLRNFRESRAVAMLPPAELARQCGPLTCCTAAAAAHALAHNSTLDLDTQRQNREYATLTFAFVHHLVADLAVMDLYDYVFKLDADLEFLHELPERPAESMRTQGCVVLHTQALGAEAWDGCYVGMRRGMREFAQHHGLQVAARGAGWCRQSDAYMYGNFVGAWVPFLRAHAQVQHLRYLYDNIADFPSTADQGAMRASLCMWYDVGSLGVRWGPTPSELCDRTAWRTRHKAFRHPGQSGEP